MPLSKARNKKRMQQKRISVQPEKPAKMDVKTFGYATKDVPGPVWLKDGN